MDKNSTLFIGLDLGDRWSHLTILDPEGQVVEESRVPTTGGALQKKFSALPAARIAMEVGTHSRWVSQALRDLGHEVLVANARKLRVIFDNPRKGDRADSHILARLARLDPMLLSPIEHRSPQAQADLDVLRSRDALVRSRTLLINHVRGVVKSAGGRIPASSARTFPSRAASSLPEPLRPALAPILDTVCALNLEIRKYDHEIEHLGTSKYPDCQRLRQIQGVGPITALAFVLTLENPRRFAKSREVGPALGLVPRRDQSGGQDPQLHITKTGNAFLRRLVVGSAQYILGPFGPDCDLRRWGLRLANHGGKNAKKRAVVAVARKLAIVMHRLWKTGDDYNPEHSAQAVTLRLAMAQPA